MAMRRERPLGRAEPIKTTEKTPKLSKIILHIQDDKIFQNIRNTVCIRFRYFILHK